MKTTDFSKIAEVYDKNPFRFEEVRVDLNLEDYLRNSSESSCKMLDLACGTGIYLDHQVTFLEEYNIDWNGLDASKEMLDQAKARVDNAAFEHGRAEICPMKTKLLTL